MAMPTEGVTACACPYPATFKETEKLPDLHKALVQSLRPPCCLRTLKLPGEEDGHLESASGLWFPCSCGSVCLSFW